MPAEPPPDQGVGPVAQPFDQIAGIYDRVMSHVPYADWVEYVQLLARHWRCRPRRILDLACGTGTVALGLATEGLTLVGVDRSRPMLLEARRKAEAAGITALWSWQDVSALALAAESFDLVVCLFDSLNYILEPTDLAATFQGVRACLDRDGLFIFDVNTEYALEAELFTQEDLEDDAPVKLQWVSRYDRASRLATVEMAFYLDDGTRLSETHHQRAYGPRELRNLLQAAGFKTLAVYDAYTFSLPKPESDRVFYVCRPA